MKQLWRLLVLWALCCAMVGWAADQPALAFFYGADPPLDELRAFDRVVLEPGQLAKAPPARPETRWYAYLSVGEISPDRPYFSTVPKAWLKGENRAWNSRVIDQTAADWPAFLVERIVTPLWERGWRAFFLDTLDSYHLIAPDPASRAAQEAGLKRALRAIKSRYPEARLLFNRGFEILPDLHPIADGVVAESLYAGWDASTRRYREVPEADRRWLLEQLGRAARDWKLPVAAIDYLPPGRRAEARSVAARIMAHGITPWVANPELDYLGVGTIEVLPRKVAVLYDSQQFNDLTYADPQRYLATPLNYLGLVPQYFDTRKPLPGFVLAGRYAGVVSWLNSDSAGDTAQLKRWFDRQLGDGVPLAFLSRFGISDDSWLAGWGLHFGNEETDPKKPVEVVHSEPGVSFEVKPYPERDAFRPLRLERGKPWLTLQNGALRADAVAITPWGGYALEPFTVITMPGSNGSDTFWVLEPLRFLREALQLPEMPIADTTTENGRRLWLTHIDGDGFPSRAELPGTPLAGEVMLRDFLAVYQVPTTVSVIEAEVAPHGLFPALAPQLESIAKRIFALPHIEIASHSYSHPFKWQAFEQAGEVEEGVSLAVKGYVFSAEREIGGSLDYIDRRLAPAGKRAQVFLWTGNCNPSTEVVASAYAHGVRNMNGGETTITRTRPSWTRIAPLGLDKGQGFQVFAPMQNENIYTNLWSGPYWGFRRVIETFEMTELPRRWKPINIYYHTYSASKPAAIEALHQVYRWAQKQQTLPLFASAYIDKVLDFNRLVIARHGEGWRIRGDGALRTFRLPETLPAPDFSRSQGLAGWRVQTQGRYLHLSDGRHAELLPAAQARPPYLHDANGRLTRWEREEGVVRLGLDAAVALEFALVQPPGCRLELNGRPLRPVAVEQAIHRYRLADHAAERLELRCPS
ncbi:bifunctional glycoside hydrolase 114/ polysaccharide deacetylase family protein [Chitinimonas lacunae]|uniref:Bifunctional glycoside hydrolase 114/ polysaccharide deacetylase family protein n=1 Tax=Chitinimonas lacunae TaxID=1963018 RepID=A0ABV8MP01_9NEIS